MLAFRELVGGFKDFRAVGFGAGRVSISFFPEINMQPEMGPLSKRADGHC